MLLPVHDHITGAVDTEWCRRMVAEAPDDPELRLRVAEALRMSASTAAMLSEAEGHLRRAVALIAAAEPDPILDRTAPTAEGAPSSATVNSIQTLALRRLALLLCQRGDDNEARPLLTALGYRYRLAHDVLHYGWPPALQSDVVSRRFVVALDDALPPALGSLLRGAFHPTAPFWSETGYDLTPRFFSFLHPLGGPPSNAMEQVLQTLHSLAVQHFPEAKAARWAEWWVHKRPHGCGHPLHFDAADEGRGGVLSPVVGSVLFLSPEGVGGPTIVTHQWYDEPRIAEFGYLSHPAPNRYLLFPGGFEHGVIPGRGVPSVPQPRVSFMVAFWKDAADARPKVEGALTGSAEPMPDPNTSPLCWPRAFRSLAPAEPSAPREVGVVALDAVWEDVDAKLNWWDWCGLSHLTWIPLSEFFFTGF